MKANQAYKADEEAVSPVVGVILMVAITVVLAAVVFVLVNNLGKGGENKPEIGFVQNQAARTLTISSAGPADWNDIEQTISTAGGAIPDNVGCTVVGNMAGANTSNDAVAAGGDTDLVSATDGTTVQANHILTVGGGTAGETCTLTLRHVPTNQSYGTWTFNF